MRRLFFALWPDASMRACLEQAVHDVVRSAGGRPVPTSQVHLTLAFLGAVRESRLVDLSRIADATARTAPRGEGVQIRLERLEYWAGPQVLCAVPRRTPVRLGAWLGTLLEQLAAEGFARDLKPFRPHVTVARKVTRPSPSMQMIPVSWGFEQFALIDSRAARGGSVYSVVAAHPLFIGATATK